jgi:hypothetical protein
MGGKNGERRSPPALLAVVCDSGIAPIIPGLTGRAQRAGVNALFASPAWD